MSRPAVFAAALILLSACNAHQDVTNAPEAAFEGQATVHAAAEQAVAAEPVDAPVVAEAQDGELQPSEAPPADLPVDGPTPQMLYDHCHDRLEGAEVDGECSVDADCGRAGCSQEVCLPAAKKGDVMTTCEILPCFGAVEACGCHEGRCTWTVKDQLEPMLPRIPIKVQ